MTKQAYVDVSCKLLSCFAQLLPSEGLEVVGSAQSPHQGCARLILEGERLPDACANPKRQLVSVVVSIQNGAQRLIAINVLPELDPAHIETRHYAPEETARLAGC